MIVGAVGLLFAGCSAQPPNGVILKEEAYAAAFDADGGMGRPYWRPGLDEINEAEIQLEAYVRRLDEPHTERLKGKLGAYGRQYVGVSDNGRRILVINGFCGGLNHPGAREQYLWMEDGGDCYFQAYYDVEAARLLYVNVNGRA